MTPPTSKDAKVEETPKRSAPVSAVERRDASMSYGDQQSLVYQALLTSLGDDAGDESGCVDIWIQDMAADWVVYHCYGTNGPGPGDWKQSYSLDSSGQVVFSGGPVAVVSQTAYVPSPEAKSRRTQSADIETRATARKAMRNVRETRSCPLDFELRDVPNGTGGNDLLFTGFASVTCAQDSDDSAYEMEDFLGSWLESVSIGAFKKTLADSADVAFLVNHEGLTLARTKSGTLKLSETEWGTPTGLHSEARLDPKSPHVKALRSAVERGDVDEMSFAFRVTRQEWSEDYDRRWINEVNLQNGDVSAVNYGANPHTGGLVAIRKRLAGADSGLVVRLLSRMVEQRAGAEFSAANLDKLTSILTGINDADSNIDQALVDLSELIGVANPDTDAPAPPNDPGTDDDQNQLGAPPPPSVAALPNHTRLARARLAALLS